LKVLAAIGVLFILILVLIVASLSTCAHKLYKSIDVFPEQAQAKHLNARYAPLIADLNSSIEKSDSAFSLASALENIDYPPETLFVGMQKEKQDNAELLIFDRRKSKSDSGVKMRMLIGAGGYGQSNGQHFWILQHPLNKYDYEHIEILFEREAPKPKHDSDTNPDTE